jgi:hypothetical protein
MHISEESYHHKEKSYSTFFSRTQKKRVWHLVVTKMAANNYSLRLLTTLFLDFYVSLQICQEKLQRVLNNFMPYGIVFQRK